MGFLVVGNLSILLVAAAARAATPQTEIEQLPGVSNLRVVDERVLRGNGPDLDSYRAMPALGVTTVVDLRAERDLDIPHDELDQLQLDYHHLPIRDGQTPTASQVEQFRQIVAESDGRVYLHCGAGVGRTGAMAAAYLVLQGEASSAGALRANLSVGPPSLEQIYYAVGLEQGHTPEQPPLVVSIASRILDAPRRTWSVVRS